ncbi:hypothetical protein [Brassicibacter mesophilus]|uniref:hypothetical protein n=1 Tax=Brassicibacter mesophilus TaxID=745119 RepID=UPI003D19D14E
MYNIDNDHLEETFLERYLISYLKKWYLGKRIDFIKKDIKKREELSNDICNKNTIVSEDIVTLNEDNWIEYIENRKIFYYFKSLPKNKIQIIYKNIVENKSLTNSAKEIGISKQLAYSYKKQILENCKKILQEYDC